mgnify:CR=1 FL=1
MIDERILCNGHENMRLVRYDELAEAGIKTVKFSELGKFTNDGVLKACFHNENGELVQLYTDQGKATMLGLLQRQGLVKRPHTLSLRLFLLLCKK